MTLTAAQGSIRQEATPAPAPRKNITVLHLLKTSVGATWALRQMRELVGLGVAVHAAMPPGPLVPRYQAAGVTVHHVQLDLPVRRPWRIPATLEAMRRLVSRIKPDVIHSHFVGTTLTMRIALGKRNPTPRVFQVPGPVHLEHSFYRRLDIALAGASDSWMASCRWTGDCYRGCGVSPERVFLSYYGVDLDDFAPREPGKLRRELNIDGTTPLVGMVAHIYAPRRYVGETRGSKGYEDLIDAVSISARKWPRLRCVIIGGPWKGAEGYANRLRQYAERTCGDRITFLGGRSDVADLYPDLDVAAHPSHTENLGGAAESLVLGVPTIATNVGGFPDIVRPGETGWLVPPRDPPALAAAIDQALADPAAARAMARRGQALARQILDIRSCARDVLDAYERILK